MLYRLAAFLLINEALFRLLAVARATAAATRATVALSAASAKPTAVAAVISISSVGVEYA